MAGGTAQRLTTHLERERFPRFSPDGSTLAFTASYDGPTEIYIMSVEGGKPVMEERSRMPALPASATASMVSIAFESDFIYY